MSEAESSSGAPHVQAPESRAKAWREGIVAACAAASLMLNVYLGFAVTREKAQADLLAQRVALERERPRLDQGRFILAGDVLKAIVDGDAAPVIDGVPSPGFADGSFAGAVLERLGDIDSLRALRSISVEFVTFTNRGPARIERLHVMQANERLLDLGGVDAGTTKLVPIAYEREQPFERLEAPAPKSFAYSYLFGGEIHQASREIAPRATVSWVPTVGNPQGVGRALSDPDSEQHLRGAARP